VGLKNAKNYLLPKMISFHHISGGGYILSKAALTKLVTKLMPNKSICRYDEYGAEDLELGLFLVLTELLPNSFLN
jgi:hypothetical protein